MRGAPGATGGALFGLVVLEPAPCALHFTSPTPDPLRNTVTGVLRGSRKVMAECGMDAGACRKTAAPPAFADVRAPLHGPDRRDAGAGGRPPLHGAARWPAGGHGAARRSLPIEMPAHCSYH